MIKPRIVQVSPGVWECACDLVYEHGATAKLAYDRWLKSALADAVANLQLVEPAEPEKVELAELTKSSSSISESRHRKDDTAKPKVGKPITVKAAPKPVAQPNLPPVKYHQSVVRIVPGTVATKEYRPAAGLLINQRRAEQSEPKLSPLAGNAKAKDGWMYGQPKS